MYRYAFSILKDSETAADVVQDCLLKIWNNRKKLAEIHSPESWAMRIARNQCYDWVKMNRFSLVGEKELSKTDSRSADSELLENDYKHWLNKIIKSLSEKQQEIFHLREVEEMAYQDIAEILGLSLSEVKVSLHRTRAKIRLEMQKIEQYGIAN
ncbi:MAG: RNA polymerase sigma factor [Bacteroidetes bacterium]|nr:RNA polymerase sigma factor [Bacteroidota bacterium]